MGAFRDTVRQDVGVLGVTPKTRLFFVAAAAGVNRFSAVFLHRISARFHSKRGLLKLLSAIAHRWNTIINGCEIDPRAEIGGGLHLPHPHGIVFGPIRAGKRLTAQQNVTVGLRDPSLDFTDPSNFPVIGDGVFIGAGAVVLGAIHIADGARIGANAVVVADVDEGETALGPKAIKQAVKPSVPAAVASKMRLARPIGDPSS